MVSYRGKDGQQSYHEVADLDEAVRFVEHLRNDESVDQARLFKMEELSFEFRPYYKVELSAAERAAEGPAAESPWLASQEAAAAAADVEVDADAKEEMDPLAAAWTASEPRPDAPVGAGMGRKGLFGR